MDNNQKDEFLACGYSFMCKYLNNEDKVEGCHKNVNVPDLMRNLRDRRKVAGLLKQINPNVSIIIILFVGELSL